MRLRGYFGRYADKESDFLQSLEQSALGSAGSRPVSGHVPNGGGRSAVNGSTPPGPPAAPGLNGTASAAGSGGNNGPLQYSSEEAATSGSGQALAAKKCADSVPPCNSVLMVYLCCLWLLL